MGVVLGICCVVLAACWAWLHLNARRLRQKTSRLLQWPPLAPLYYAALSSTLTKPRRIRKHVSVQEQQITVGARPPGQARHRRSATIWGSGASTRRRRYKSGQRCAGPVRVDVDRNLKLRRLCGDAGHDPQVWLAQAAVCREHCCCAHSCTGAFGQLGCSCRLWRPCILRWRPSG